MGNKKKAQKSIPQPQFPEGKNLKFSFEYYDTKNSRYCLSNFTKKQILRTMTCLKDICTKTYNDLRTGTKTYRFHSVDWTKTTENKFPYTKINQLEAFQFGLVGVNQQKARVFGAYNGNIFYIVWFDLEHNIWPSFKKHT